MVWLLMLGIVWNAISIFITNKTIDKLDFIDNGRKSYTLLFVVLVLANLATFFYTLTLICVGTSITFSRPNYNEDSKVQCRTAGGEFVTSTGNCFKDGIKLNFNNEDSY